MEDSTRNRGERKPHDLYRIYDEADDLLYVGISYSALARIAQHRDSQPWWTKVANVKVERLGTLTRSEAETIERDVIHAEQPRHNVIHNRPTPTKAPKPASSSREKPHHWRCWTCEKVIPHGHRKGYVQVPQFSDVWECVCAKCDSADTARYWIDSQRISTVADVLHWTDHLLGKRWFDVDSWLTMLYACCEIDDAPRASKRAIRERYANPKGVGA